MRTVLFAIAVGVICGLGAFYVMQSGIIKVERSEKRSVAVEIVKAKLDKEKGLKAEGKKVLASKDETESPKEEKKKEVKPKFITDPNWPLVPMSPNSEEIEMFELIGPYGEISECSALVEEESYKKHQSQKYMIPGKDSWVFRTRQDLEMDYKFRKDKIALFQIFTKVMRLKGTEPVIAYIPPRAVMASSKLKYDNDFTKDFDPEVMKEEYYAQIKEFQDRGVNLVTIPYAVDGEKLFNWSDHHWNTQGAKAMALAVSDFIKKTDKWKGLEKQEFVTIRRGAEAYDGLYGRVTRDICGFVPYPERDVIYETSRKDASPEDMLLGEDTAPPVVLIGTSNSKRGEFNSNFDGFMKEALSLDIYNAALSGGGMDDSMIQYLDSDLYKQNQPAFLIWELPAYYNLGGSGMEMSLRYAIPAALGSCEDPIYTFGPEEITDKRLRIVNDVEKQNIKPDQTYLEMVFDRPLKKDFSISIKTTDRKTKLIKFESPHEGKGDHFFYLLNSEDENTFLYSIGINNGKGHLDGVTVSGKLCSLPESVLPTSDGG